MEQEGWKDPVSCSDVEENNILELDISEFIPRARAQASAGRASQHQHAAKPQPEIAGGLTPGTVSDELIDLIVRRVIERMSDDLVREIAWEVVPELAEMIVKQRLQGGRASDRKI